MKISCSQLELRTAIELFIAESSAFETYFVRMALRSLSNDISFMEQTERLLGLEAQVTCRCFGRQLQRRP